mgnify:FL=1
MKKIIALMLAALTLLSFSGCGKKELNYAKSPEVVKTERGVWDGNTYRGGFTDISFSLPDGWEILSDDEIKEISGDTDGITYDMMCQKSSTGSVVTVLFEELLKTSATNKITEEEYVKTVADNLYNMGFSVSEPDERKIGKNTYTYVSAYGEGGGMTVNQYSLVRKEKGYMISVIVTASNGDDAEEILKRFS